MERLVSQPFGFKDDGRFLYERGRIAQREQPQSAFRSWDTVEAPKASLCVRNVLLSRLPVESESDRNLFGSQQTHHAERSDSSPCVPAKIANQLLYIAELLYLTRYLVGNFDPYHTRE